MKIKRNIAEVVRQTLRQAGANTTRPVIVALSGGADSVALLYLLLEHGFDCRAAHCNFHLRGEESMRDMRHVQTLCARLGTDLYIRDFDVAAQMADTGESTEMACRTLRYRWFDELLDRERAAYIAVGHHREDRAETFMLNLMRGAGLEGLTSMRVVEGNILRPLLTLSRAEIEEYLADRGLTFVTDSTNAQNEYRRNSLRNRVFPLLAEIFGDSALDSVVRTVENLERTRTFYRKAVDERINMYYDGSSVDIDMLISREEQPELMLFEILRDKHFNFEQAAEIIRQSDSSGLEFHSSDHRIVAELSYGRLLLTDAARRSLNEGSYPVKLNADITEPVRIHVENLPVSAFKLPDKDIADHAFFDADFAPGHFWELRHYRRGDRMIPFGAKRSKLLSDLFANAKYSAADKRNTWLLLCDGEIVWAAGLKNSAFATVNPETRRFIHLHFIGNEPS